MNEGGEEEFQEEAVVTLALLISDESSDKELLPEPSVGKNKVRGAVKL